MAIREFTYKGKTLDELKSMSIEEFSLLLPARERRSIKRGLTEAEKKLLERLRKKGNNVKTHCRDMIIVPEMVNKKILVHKGNKFEAVVITPEMLGHRLGEFVQSRSRVQHSSPGVGATRSSQAISAR